MRGWWQTSREMLNSRSLDRLTSKHGLSRNNRSRISADDASRADAHSSEQQVHKIYDARSNVYKICLQKLVMIPFRLSRYL